MRFSGVKRNNSLMVSPIPSVLFDNRSGGSVVALSQVSDTLGLMDSRLTLNDQFPTSKCQRLLSDTLSTLPKRRKLTSSVNCSRVTSLAKLPPRLLFDGFPEL